MSVSKLVLVALPVIVFRAIGADAAPIRWDVADGGNGHFYDVIVVGTPMTWDAARSGAKAIGPDWDLATITSAAESAFVKGLFSSNPSAFTIHVGSNCPGPWIGGFDVLGATNFQWVTGEAVTSTDWGPSEPFGNGDAIAYGDFSLPCGDGSGVAWNDFPGDILRSDSPIAYVAEGLTVTTPTTTTTTTSAPNTTTTTTTIPRRRCRAVCKTLRQECRMGCTGTRREARACK